MEPFNYFNYFTEIEEYFWRKRGAHLLVSPLDWAIVETWQKAGIPLEAVLRGIDSAFESYERSRRGAGRPLKSLAYCVDAVLDAATEKQESSAGSGPEPKRKEKKAEPFSREELRGFCLAISRSWSRRRGGCALPTQTWRGGSRKRMRAWRSCCRCWIRPPSSIWRIWSGG